MKELYTKFVKKPLEMVDSGELFKKGLFLTFKIAAIAFVLFGLYMCISGLFGDYGYFNSLRGADGFLMIRCIVTFLITFVISLATFLVLGIILWYQGDNIKERYDGVVFLPSRFFKIIGQLIAVVVISSGLINFIASLFAGIPYSQINILNYFLPTNISILGMAQMQRFSIPNNAIAYFSNLLFIGLLGLVFSVIIAFLSVIVTYILANLYEIFVRFFKNGGDHFKSGKK